MSINISYNATEFPSPQPFVEREQEVINYGGIWGQRTKIILNGIIDDVSTSIPSSKQTSILNALSKDYQPLNIGSVTFPIAKIININFEQSNYIGITNYQVEFECYESDIFNGTFGVLDPVNEYSYEENPDNTITITHNISAKGFSKAVSNADALDNAKNFVNNLCGLKQLTAIPHIISKNITLSASNVILIRYVESIDQINCKYSVQEQYITKATSDPDLTIPGQTLIKYAVEINKDAENDFKIVSIRGEIIGNLINLGTITTKTPMTTLRSVAKDLPLKNICESVSSITPLEPIPQSINFNEDPTAGKISFSAEFTSNNIDTTDTPYFDYIISVDHDIINNIATFSINGSIKTRLRNNLKDRYSRILTWYNENVDSYSGGVNNIGPEGYLYNILNAFYLANKAKLNIFSAFLNTKANDISIVKSPFNGEITMSASFNDNVNLLSFDIQNINYNIEVIPSINIYKPNATFNVNSSYRINYLGPNETNSNTARTLEKVNITLDINFVHDTLIATAQGYARTYMGLIRTNYSKNGSEFILQDEKMSFNNAEGALKTKSISYQVLLINKTQAATPFVIGGASK